MVVSLHIGLLFLFFSLFYLFNFFFQQGGGGMVCGFCCIMCFRVTEKCHGTCRDGSMKDIVPALAHCSKEVVVALWFGTRGTTVIVIAVKGFANILSPNHHLVPIPFPDYLERRIVCTSFMNNVSVRKELATLTVKRATTLIA